MRKTMDSRFEGQPSIFKLAASEIGFGGGERIFLDIAKALVKLDISVVISTSRNSKLGQAVNEDDTFNALERNQKSKATVLVANDFKSLFQSSLSFGIRRGLICHGPWELTWKKKVYLKLFQVHLLCVSNYVAGFTQRGLRLHRSKIHVLKYGPDLREINVVSDGKFLAREEFGILPEDTVVGSLSRYHSVKRIDELIEMFRGREEILLLGLSTGFNTQDEIQTKKIVDKIKLPPNVKIFENVKSEVFLNAIDILISLSSSETLGLTFLEASARGVPSFTTAKGGPNDFLIHGLNGYFLKHESLRENAEEFFNLIKDKRVLDRLSKNAKDMNHHRSPEISAIQIIGILR